MKDLNPEKKPMCLVAVDQPLVDDLTRLVVYLGGAFNVHPDEVMEPLRALYEQCMASRPGEQS